MSKLKIIIATGIFPPALGGPATFAQNLYEGLKSKGHNIKVITFCRERAECCENIVCVPASNLIFLRYFYFFLYLWKLSKGADIIYAFDLISVGLPCALVKLLRKKIKLVYRVGGDFQWEAALQKGYFDNTLWKYWEEKRFSFYEKMVFRATNFSLKKADFIIFNANLIKDVFLKYRGVPEYKSGVIKNFSPDASEVLADLNQKQSGLIKIIFIGRLIAMKNLIRLLKAFQELIRREPLKKKWRMELAGEGPEEGRIKEYVAENGLSDYVAIRPKMSRQDVLKEIKSSQIIANVSLTEVNAHFVAEALSLRKPIILTKESEQFYTGQKNELIYYVDPLDIDDIAEKILQAAKAIGAGTFLEKIQIHDFTWPAERVVKEHEAVFSRLLAQ